LRFAQKFGLVSCFVASAFLCSCGSSQDFSYFTGPSGGNGSGASNATPTALRITPNPVTRQVGETQQFVATASFSDGSSLDVTSATQWTSSNVDSVTINATSGLATALLPGQSTITAQIQGFQETAVVTVSRLVTRVSVSSAGVEGNGNSLQANISNDSVSADGRFVVFESDASNLVANDTNGVTDLFVHDRQTGTTTRINLSSTGEQADLSSYKPRISDDGRFISFNSSATNLVPGDTNGQQDSFVHDRDTGLTTRVSVDSLGVQGNSGSFETAISGDGQIVAFNSEASNLVSGDSNNRFDVFVHDRQTGFTTRVSVDSAAVQGNGHSVIPSLSLDGRFVAFESVATNLVAGDGNGRVDVFVHDRQTGATTRVSQDPMGASGDGDSFEASISADGRFVAFESQASNLVAGDTNAINDVFVHDRQLSTTQRASLSSSAAQADNASGAPSISGNGRFVAFHSNATNLVGADTNASRDVFVRDLQSATTSLVSQNATGTQANSASSRAAISADGRFVAFESSANNLVSGDANSFTDVFLTTR